VDRRRLRLPSLVELEAKIQAGEYQLHAFDLGIVISELKQYDGERVLVAHLLSGERFDEWKEECVERLREFAAKHECSAIEALCRPALARTLKRIGWRTRNVQVRLSLTERESHGIRI